MWDSSFEKSRAVYDQAFKNSIAPPKPKPNMSSTLFGIIIPKQGIVKGHSKNCAIFKL
jgi:hypothetical protein